MKLDIQDLTIVYRSAAQTVRPVESFDLTVESGELTLLHGPSGCGKTSLLSAVAGLLTPESGAIRIDGEDVVGLRGRALTRHRRSGVGVVFQSFNLIPCLTALENVALPLTTTGIPRTDARTTARRLLGELGLEHRKDHRPDAMSGGQQQRVAIARAIAADPPVLLADEPTAHLDHDQVDTVRELFRDLTDQGRIVLVSTHDDRLEGAADRIVRL